MIDRFLETWRHMAGIEGFLVAAIAAIALTSFILLLASVSRRLYNAHKYHVLDGLREDYLPLLREMAKANRCTGEDLSRLKAQPQSARWTAIEDDLFLLLHEGMAESFILRLFGQLEYVRFYREMLDRRSPITQAAGISKLGMIRDSQSAGRLLEMLEKEDPEIIVASVRAFCEIGEVTLFPRFFAMLSVLLDKKLVTMKIIETSLAMTGQEAIPALLQCGRVSKDPRIVSSILKVLGDASADNTVYNFALSHLGHGDPEVRAKALKVIANQENAHGTCSLETWPQLLKDPVWFVRLQAVRAIGKQRCKEFIEDISSLVVDEKWQVRNAAAEALTGLGEDAIDIFLRILKSSDNYAKESICEVMQKTGFVENLLSMLDKGRRTYASSMYEIFTIMASLGFTSQLRDYLVRTEDRSIAVIIDLGQHAPHQEDSPVAAIPTRPPSRTMPGELRSAS